MGRVPGSPAQSFGGERSQSLLAAVGAVLRRADEHFDEVIVQCIEELALEAPLELRVIEIARMEVEVIGVHGNGFVFELDDDFNALALGARGEVQKWMFVEPQLGEDTIKSNISTGSRKKSKTHVELCTAFLYI